MLKIAEIGQGYFAVLDGDRPIWLEVDYRFAHLPIRRVISSFSHSLVGPYPTFVHDSVCDCADCKSNIEAGYLSYESRGQGSLIPAYYHAYLYPNRVDVYGGLVALIRDLNAQEEEDARKRGGPLPQVTSGTSGTSGPSHRVTK
jgi:hypothetical protein